MKNFRQFIKEEKEMKVGGYQTTHHYMCPSAIRFLKKRGEGKMQTLRNLKMLQG